MKTTKTIKKILSIALCLALVMSYIPMVSLTAFAADGNADEYTVTVNITDANVSYYDVGIFANGGVIQKTNYSANETVTVRVLVTEGYVASVTVKGSSGETISYTKERELHTFTMPAGNVLVDISAVLCSHPTEAQGYVHSYDDQGNSTHHEKWCFECYSTIADSQEVHTFVNSIYKCDTCGYSNTRLVITEASGEKVNAMNVAPGTALTAKLFDSNGDGIAGVTYKWRNFDNILHTGSTYTVPYDMVDSFVEIEAWLGEVKLGIDFVFCAEPTDDCQHYASEDIYSTGNVIAIRCAACRGDLGMTATVSVPDEALVYTGAEQKVATVIYSDGWQEQGKGELEILYEGDCTNVGTHKAIIWYQGVSAEISFKIGCNEHYTEKDENKATCTTQAVCQACGASYGEVDKTNHDETMASDEYTNGFCPHCDSYQPATQNEDGYYEIGNAGQLMWFAQLVNNGETSANAILMADIDMDGIGTWSIMQTYDGTLDGNGYTIQGLNQNAGLGDGEQQGFIRRLTGTVKNTTFKNCSAFQQDSLGCAIIAYNNSGTISGCMVVGCNVQLGNYGGLALVTGRNLSGGVIENCGVVGGNITRRFSGINNQGMAAITEQNGGTVQNCFAYGYNLNSNDSKLGALVYSGNAPVNSYYYYSGDKVLDSTVESIAKTAEQFASGEVAYLLQQGNTEQVWGQDSNQEGATPILDSTGLYKVVTVAETGNYSVANVGDTNGDGTVDVTDYQALVNMAISDGHSQSETASYDDIVKYDLNGDGYIDVLDASLMSLFINGFKVIPVYAVGDYDLNGVAFEESDLKAIKHAVENPESLATYKKYACDINGDGKVSADDATLLINIYGEITGTSCEENLKISYRWSTDYSACTATALCTLCGDVYETGIGEVYSFMNADPTCTEEGSMSFEAYFENPDLFEPQYVEIPIEKLPHDLCEWTDNGDGTHSKSCVDCDYIESESKKHNFDENGKCACGAIQITDVNAPNDDDHPFGDGWSNDGEEDLDSGASIGTQDVGKTAWEKDDQIIVTLTSETIGTQTCVLTYDGGNWTLDGSFVYAEGETPTVTAVYAPAGTSGMGEYIPAVATINGNSISISFEGAIRDYSRLRIVGLPNQTLTVTTTGFTPAGASAAADGTTYTVTTNGDGNAYLYGTFAKDATVTVKYGAVILAEFTFSEDKNFANGTEHNKSYALDARPIIDGTLGGKATATEDDIKALVEQIKTYVDNGITTITVTGSNPATISTVTAIGEAIYRLSGSGTYDPDNPYNGKIDLILPDVTEIVDYDFYKAYALNSINLPKVTTVGEYAFEGCWYLQELTFGSVVTLIKNERAFNEVGDSVGGCALVLNKGQANAETEYQPNIGAKSWWKTLWNSITLY